MGKRAVYPGMFDPMHNGHLDLIERSLRIFDELIVAVVANPSKEPLFTVKERLEMIDECTTGIGMSRMRMTSFDGLLIDLVDREGADCIVRGLRAVSDFEYEFQMTLMNQKLCADLVTIFLMPTEQFTYLNAGLVKEVAKNGGSVTGLVPPEVEQRLRLKLAENRVAIRGTKGPVPKPVQKVEGRRR